MKRMDVDLEMVGDNAHWSLQTRKASTKHRSTTYLLTWTTSYWREATKKSGQKSAYWPGLRIESSWRVTTKKSVDWAWHYKVVEGWPQRRAWIELDYKVLEGWLQKKSAFWLGNGDYEKSGQKGADWPGLLCSQRVTTKKSVYWAWIQSTWRVTTKK